MLPNPPSKDTIIADNGQKPPHKADKQRKSVAARFFSAVFIFCLIFFFCAFTALGVWQVKRLAWKEDLIARVNARVHLPPVPAPLPAEWGTITAEKDAYRPVYIKGRLLHDKEILVKASVLLDILDETGGAGYWVMTPLSTPDGTITFINRGFVPLDKTQQKSLPQSEVTINGLLRLSEGPGRLFNKNDPQNNIWYHRQLPALAQAVGLPPAKVAPYFIDADRASNPDGWPRGGLTEIHFTNNHLVYALTWFSGALGVLLAAVLVIRSKKQEKSAAGAED
ncbi:SURF1 family protein [Candidatus Tokpelaia sp.]|uniref:SURF1 family protein n=1 Tax=Candidatus Tokpelaia sp. TaxID=2233777 RepID=UPI00123BFB63|nr:SURF1 family protein [Candidatus Tokpelaia sp.]KAA6405583.1 SURF1 family protein [Candidatus Tokpelaia sp.]